MTTILKIAVAVAVICGAWAGEARALGHGVRKIEVSDCKFGYLALRNITVNPPVSTHRDRAVNGVWFVYDRQKFARRSGNVGALGECEWTLIGQLTFKDDVVSSWLESTTKAIGRSYALTRRNNSPYLAKSFYNLLCSREKTLPRTGDAPLRNFNFEYSKWSSSTVIKSTVEHKKIRFVKHYKLLEYCDGPSFKLECFIGNDIRLPRFSESSPNQNHAYRAESHAYQGGSPHDLSPPRRHTLGGKVKFYTLIFACGLICLAAAVFGFQRVRSDTTAMLVVAGIVLIYFGAVGSLVFNSTAY